MKFIYLIIAIITISCNGNNNFSNRTTVIIENQGLCAYINDSTILRCAIPQDNTICYMTSKGVIAGIFCIKKEEL